MHPAHANCAHPKRFVRRFGGRRRQCSHCKDTWRIRRKKRGRKRVRATAALALRYLARDIPALRVLARRRHIGKDHAHLLLRRSLESYVAARTEWWRMLPASGALILIADAIWYRVRSPTQIKQTIYVLLVRPACGTDAIIAPPAIYHGHEDIAGWERAYQTLPASIRGRICALVCDGGTGIVALARRHKLLLQRCHFHLLSAVQNYLTTGPRSSQRAYALRILRLVQQAVRAPVPDARRALRTLKEVQRFSRSRGLRRVLNGLVRDWQEYRTYRSHPELHLPATNNTAESCIQGIRDLMYRCRGFSSLASLCMWLTAFALFKKTIRCNGASTKLNH